MFNTEFILRILTITKLSLTKSDIIGLSHQVSPHKNSSDSILDNRGS